MIVKNPTSNEVAVMFDGMHVYFKPNQKKMFEDNIGQTIIDDSGKVLVEETEEDEKVVKPVESKVVESTSEDVFTEKITKKGTQYRKNGKLISKEDYDAR